MNKNISFFFIFLSILLIGIFILNKRQTSHLAIPQSVTVQKPADPPSIPIGQRTKSSGCLPNGALPDLACTPGSVFSGATKDQICVSGYSATVRNVPGSEKTQVYQEYGIISHTTGQYEVDHLISLELGGSNDIANLWPEAADPSPGFHQKDSVENYLHAQVCNGNISLLEAQQDIATNWLGIYGQINH